MSNNHNLLFNIYDKNELIIDNDKVDSLIIYLEQISKEDKCYDGLYDINNTNQLLNYIGEYTYHNFKIYKLNFKSSDEYILFLYCNIALFLTQFSYESISIVKLLSTTVKEKIDSLLMQEIYSYVNSYDTRGLFYFLCFKYRLPFDKIIENKLINYEYQEPSINKKWQKSYKKDGEPITFWFYNTMIGQGLFLVLYGPKCRYKIEKGGCAGCNLPAVSSSNSLPNNSDIKEQADNTFSNLLSKKEKNLTKELMLSNNGSILDSNTMPIESLSYCVQKAINNFPNLKKIIFETRIDDYTNFKQLKDIYEKIKEYNLDISLELAIGFEIYDDYLRNNYYKKGLDKKTIEEKIKELSGLNVSLKVYVMYKAVPDSYMNVDDAIKDIDYSSEYFSKLSTKYNLDINLHISPTYLATGTQLYKDYKDGLYTPLSTKDIKKLFDELKVYENLSYYISMNDEGLSDDRLLNSSDYEEYLELSNKIHKFNIENYR